MDSESLKCSELSSDWQCLLDLTFPEPLVPVSQTNLGFVESQTDGNRCNYVVPSPSNSRSSTNVSPPLKVVEATQTQVKPNESGESFYPGERKHDPQRYNCDKNSEEYRKRRERNNIAVRRSREKAKQKILAKEDELKMLVVSNACLKRRCEVLEEEVKILRSVHEAFGSRLDPVWVDADQRLKALRQREEILRQEELPIGHSSREKTTGV